MSNTIPLLNGDDVVVDTSSSSFSDQDGGDVERRGGEEEVKIRSPMNPMSPSQLSRQSTAILLGRERKNTPKFLFMRGLSTDHPRSLRLKKFFGAECELRFAVGSLVGIIAVVLQRCLQRHNNVVVHNRAYPGNSCWQFCARFASEARTL